MASERVLSFRKDTYGVRIGMGRSVKRCCEARFKRLLLTVRIARLTMLDVQYEAQAVCDVISAAPPQLRCSN